MDASSMKRAGSALVRFEPPVYHSQAMGNNETKGNVALKSQFADLTSGISYWHEAAPSLETNPLMRCDFNVLSFKLQVLGRLRLYAQIADRSKTRPTLLYLCSGSDEFCRIVETFDLSVTTLDMYDNAFSRKHISKKLENDSASIGLVRDLIAQNELVLWDTSIGHLDQGLVKALFPYLKGKTYLLGLYDVPKLHLFGPRVKSNPMMVNIIRNSPTMSAELYRDVLKGCALRFSVDLGAFSLLLYDNIMNFPFNDITAARALKKANSA